MSNELTLPERAAVALGSSKHEKELILLVEESRTITEIKNADGRAQCHAARMRLKNSRIAIDKTAEAAVEDAKAFTKAVKSEKDRLIAITSSEEDRLQSLQDQWDADREAERQAKIEAERKRIAGIRDRIEAVRALPLHAVGKPAAEISQMILQLAGTPDYDSFQEFAEEYKAVRLEVLDKLAKAETAQRNADIEAEAQRQEAARIKAEREELARLRAESARQQAEAQARIDAERAELDRQRAEIDAIRQAEEDRRLAEIAAQEAEAERQRLQAAADQALIDARNPEVVTILDNDDYQATLVPPDASVEWEAALRATLFPGDAPTSPLLVGELYQFGQHVRPTDTAIIACIAETFNVPDLVAVDYLRAMDLDSIRARLLIADDQPA